LGFAGLTGSPTPRRDNYLGAQMKPVQSLTKLKGLSVLGIWILIIAIGVYVGFIALLYIFQSHYIYYPERVLSANPSRIGLEFESVYFETLGFIPYI